MKPIIKQKYKIGDKVRIQKDLPRSMSHFKSDQEVIIMGSYEDQYRHEYVSSPEYTVLFLETGNVSSWYPEKVLHFIEHVGHEGIYEAIEKRQQREAEEKIKQEKNKELVKEMTKKLTKEFDTKDCFIETSIDALILKKMMEAVEKTNQH